MPKIVLSPLSHDNPVLAEHHGLALPYIHALTAALETHLKEAGIEHTRTADRAQGSDTEGQTLHLALHSNIAHDGLSGMLRGINILHPPGDGAAAQAATVFMERLKEVYPLPQYVRTEENASAQGAAPSLLLELGYQDNSADAAFFQYRREEVALALTSAARSVLRASAKGGRARPSADAENPSAIAVFMPLEEMGPSGAEVGAPSPPDGETQAPAPERRGLARAPFGGLVLRERPEGTSPILATAPNDSPLTILDTVGDWYLLRFGDSRGYANRSFVTLL